MLAMTRVLEVPVEPSTAELVADQLWQLGASGIEERDGVLIASFPTDAAVDEVAAAVPGGTVVDVGDVAGRFDLVLANLSAATLVALAPDLVARVADHGALVVSGLLPGQWRHVQPSLDRLTTEAVIEADGWLAVVLSRR